MAEPRLRKIKQTQPKAVQRVRKNTGHVRGQGLDDQQLAVLMSLAFPPPGRRQRAHKTDNAPDTASTMGEDGSDAAPSVTPGPDATVNVGPGQLAALMRTNVPDARADEAAEVDAPAESTASDAEGAAAPGPNAPQDEVELEAEEDDSPSEAVSDTPEPADPDEGLDDSGTTLPEDPDAADHPDGSDDVEIDEPGDVGDAVEEPNVAGRAPEPRAAGSSGWVELPELPELHLLVEQVSDALRDLRETPDNGFLTGAEIDSLRGEIVAARETLWELGAGIEGVRDDLVEASRATARTGTRVDQLTGLIQRREAEPPGGIHPVVPYIVVGFALVVLTWAVVVYVRTGEVRLALGGIVIGNIAVCVAVMASRLSLSRR